MTEVSEAAKVITSAADEDAKIIFGAVIDEKMKDQIKITVVATGFDGRGRNQQNEISKSYTPNSFIAEKELEREVEAEMDFASKEKSKFSVFKSAPIKPVIEKKIDIPPIKPKKEEPEDDDLSVPAFIRKKMG